jgi:hypothetical protein
VLLSLLLFMLCWRSRRLDIVVRGTGTGFCHSYCGRRRGGLRIRGEVQRTWLKNFEQLNPNLRSKTAFDSKK